MDTLTSYGSASPNIAAGQTQQSSLRKDVPFTVEMADAKRAHIDTALNTLKTLQSIRDRLFGPSPTGEADAKGRAQGSCGFADDLRDLNTNLSNILFETQRLTVELAQRI